MPNHKYLGHFSSFIQSKTMTPFFFLGSCCREDLLLNFDLLVKENTPLEAPVYNPWQADLLIVAGPVNFKQIELLQRAYAEMLAPRWVMAIGTCALTGAGFHSGIVSRNIAEIVPVDILIPGCPPSLADLQEGFQRLHAKILEGGRE